jgi:hypothetical protein
MRRRTHALRRRYGRASDRTRVVIRGRYQTSGLDRGRILWTGTYVEHGHTVARLSGYRLAELEEWGRRFGRPDSHMRLITIGPHGRAPERMSHAEFEAHVRAKQGRR